MQVTSLCFSLDNSQRCNQLQKFLRVLTFRKLQVKSRDILRGENFLTHMDTGSSQRVPKTVDKKLHHLRTFVALNLTLLFEVDAVLLCRRPNIIKKFVFGCIVERDVKFGLFVINCLRNKLLHNLLM